MRHQGPRSACAVFCSRANRWWVSPSRPSLRLPAFCRRPWLECRSLFARPMSAQMVGANLARRTCIASGSRPRKIIGATSRRCQSCAAAQDFRRNRVRRGLFPILAWLAARYRPAFSAAGAFVVSIMIVLTTILGKGHFGDPSLPITDRVLGAQASILVVALSAYVLPRYLPNKGRVRNTFVSPT